MFSFCMLACDAFVPPCAVSARITREHHDVRVSLMNRICKQHIRLVVIVYCIAHSVSALVSSPRGCNGSVCVRYRSVLLCYSG